MIYIFEDGRIVYDEKELKYYSDGYVAIESLPPIPEVSGSVGYCRANLETNTVEVAYDKIPEEVPVEPTPEPPLSQTEQTLMQMAVNMEYLATMMEFKQ